MTKRKIVEILASLSKEQLIFLIQAILEKLGKKKTISGIRQPKHIVIHHAASNHSFEQIDNYHRKKWGFRSSLGHYMGYHYFIDKRGQMTQARSDNEEAAHTVEPGNPHYWNRNSIGVCIQGNTMVTEPTEKQLSKLEDLLSAKRIQCNIGKDEIYGHKDISATLCPGKHLFSWLEEYKKT